MASLPNCKQKRSNSTGDAASGEGCGFRKPGLLAGQGRGEGTVMLPGYRGKSTAPQAAGGIRDAAPTSH